MNDEEVMGAWLTELSNPTPDPTVIASLESVAEANGWQPNTVLTTLLARTDFSPDLHPRGRDGKFIEKFGLVKLLGNVVAPDGRRVDAKGRRGMVEGIDPDPRTPGRPNIRVRMIGPDGRPGPPVHVKPDMLEQAPEKARLDAPRPAKPSMSQRIDTAFNRLRGGQRDQPRRIPPPPDPQAEERRLAQSEVRGMPQSQLDYQETVGPAVWREAVAAEKANRAARRASDDARRQKLMDGINAQAAQLSTTDAEERAAGLDDILAQLRFSIIDTDQVHDRQYPPDDSGLWTKERTAQHEEMWDELLANVEAAGIPRDHDAFVLGGLPGAGKSYSLRPGQQAEKFGVQAWEPNVAVPESATHVSVNPDVVKEMLIAKGMLPEGLSDDMKPMEKVTFLHEESSYVAKLFSARLGELGYNVVLDNTFDSEGGMLKRMTPLAREGYTFRGLFADIPVEESKQSARDRYIRAALSPEGGRFVPSSVQGNRGTSSGNMSKNRDAFDTMVKQDWFKEYLVIDNTGVTTGNPKGEITSEGTSSGNAALAYRPGHEKNPPKAGPRLPTAPEPAPTIAVEHKGTSQQFDNNAAALDAFSGAVGDLSQFDEAAADDRYNEYDIGQRARRTGPGDDWVGDYVDWGYTDVNKALRDGGEPDDPTITESIEGLDKTIAEHGSPSPAGLLRGVSSDVADWEIGHEFTDKAYGSWTPKPEVALKFARANPDKGSVVMRLTNSEGIRSVPGKEAEYESVLPRDMNYRVTGTSDFTSPDGVKHRVVDVEAVTKGDGGTPEVIGGDNKTSLSPAGAEALANDVKSGKPIDPSQQDVDDVIDQFADSPNPVDLTLMSQFAAMRASGIPRAQMPQISKQHTAAFQDRLRDSGVDFGPGMVDPLDLKATQSELDGKTVGGIMRAAREGTMDLKGHPIWVSNDGYVLDGHHRWGAASALSANCGGNGCVQVPVIRVDLPMSDLLAFANTFNDDMGVQRLGFGESLPGGQIAPAPAAASGFVAAAKDGLPEPDEDGNYEMATDEEDGVNPDDLAELSHGDGSAFGYKPKGDKAAE